MRCRYRHSPKQKKRALDQEEGIWQEQNLADDNDEFEIGEDVEVMGEDEKSRKGERQPGELGFRREKKNKKDEEEEEEEKKPIDG